MIFPSCVEKLFDDLRLTGTGLLLLDYDGTIAPFVDDRLLARPDEHLAAAIRQIVAQDKTRVVFITGRPCREMIEVSGLDIPLEVWGCHGREYRDCAGNVRTVGVTDEMMAMLRAAAVDAVELLAMEEFTDALIEEKTGCLAIHWRKAPREKWNALEEIVRRRWSPFQNGAESTIGKFDGGLELCFGQRSKGDAVDDLLLRYGGAGAPAVFLGDDVTDEDGFLALKGRGLSILVGSNPRKTAADARIETPSGVLAFLQRWLKSLEQVPLT
ncbi:trehalose-phosphatase [soil metagenome]